MPKAKQYQIDFIREFGELLVKHGKGHGEDLGVRRMELTEDGETVNVWWDEEYKTPVCVACDSLGAMVYDIMKRIL